MKRKICVVTGTRAEYGLFYWILKELQASNIVDLQIVVTGMHLSPEFGLTYRQIEQDGFVITDQVDMLLSSDSPTAIAKSVGLGVIGMADCFRRLQPDVLLLLGDRYETFAAAQAAMILQIPVAHIHGGETSEGVIDEAIRHSLTKISQYHFVAAEVYRKRVIQLGEHPNRVFCVGAPGLDHIQKLHLLTKEELEQELGLSLLKPIFLITYHPVTLESEQTEKNIESLLQALDVFENATLIFTKANSDTNGRIINEKIADYVVKHPHRTKLFTSLGQLRYLSMMQHCDVVVGNSSSGLIEVPLFQKPTVNIGSRQNGRLKAASVIDCLEDKKSIVQAIQYALSTDFQNKLPHTVSLYGNGNASEKIVKLLKELPMDSQILQKSFYDLTKDDQSE